MSKYAPLLMLVLLAVAASAQTPVPTWTAPHPSTVSGVAIDETALRIATSCFDGNARRYNLAGMLLATTDVSPGTIDQDRQAVAYRFGMLVCGEHDDYALAIRDDQTVCTKANVPTTRTVRAISRRGLFAVADDLTVYNLTTGESWWTGSYNLFAVPMGCAEDGDTVWTCDLDGWLKRWTAHGDLLAAFYLTGSGLNSVDVNADRIVVTDWDRGIWLLDKSGQVQIRAFESSLIHEAKFTPSGSIVYGTAGDVGARLVLWDGHSVTNAAPTTPTTKPKPGKRK